VTSATKASSAVATRYAVALIDLAEEAKILDKVDADLGDLRSMMNESSDLAALVRSPRVNRARQEAALDALAEKAKFQKLTRNFLGVLARNRRMAALEAITAAFHKELSRRRGEITVNVQTAQDMTPAQLKALQDALSKSMNADVIVHAKVEPSILGGMIVTVGSHMIDDSVARKLERLKAAMNKQSNENTLSTLEGVG
jgi:F-type H+-transporting ATPase subunit delta